MLASSRVTVLPSPEEAVVDTDRRIALAAAAETDPATARFDPESILPQQFFAGGSGAMLSGEKRLMVAILGDAIATYLKYARSTAPKARGLFAEAREWIESRDQTWPFSFERICEALDVEPDRLRIVARARRRTAMARSGPTIAIRAPVMSAVAQTAAAL